MRPKEALHALLCKLGLFSLAAAQAMPAAAATPSPTPPSVSQYQEEGKLIRAPRALTVLGQDLFGDKVNLYTGALEFVQNDVGLPGNNALPVAMGRRLVTGTAPTEGMPFGRWDMEIPHLHGIFAAGGWKTGVGPSGDLRCSNFAAPPDALGEHVNNPAYFKATEFWHGNFIYVPGQGDQEMLKRRYGNAVAPGSDAARYPVVTRNNWQFSCLPAMAYGGGGEGFLALAPDGTTYRFDWMVGRPLWKMSKSNPAPDSSAAQTPGQEEQVTGLPMPDSLPKDDNQLSRSEVWILPTLVTDRFGNSVKYTYNPDPQNRWQLLSIVSADADGASRALYLTYVSPTSPLVSTVTDGVRTWRYNYNGTTRSAELTSVTLPDNSTWQLAGIYPLLKEIELWGGGGCEGADISPEVLSGFMVHPSGARGDFTLTPTRHGRSGVPNECYTDGATMAQTARYPRTFSTYALTSKRITGPGLIPLVWSTAYPPLESSWAPCNGCVNTKTVEVTDPEGNRTRHTFGTLFHETEAMLQRTELVDRSGQLLRTTSVEYAEPVPPWGVSEQGRGDGQLAARVMETARRTIEQQGVSFVWQANAFNGYAQPAEIARASGLGYGRTETTSYNNNTTRWVLGQVEQVTEKSTGKVPVLNRYNANTANLEAVTRFGQLEQTFEYYADGTLYRRKDGKGQATTYSSYKRGIPRTVRYADNTTESATVDNLGLVRTVTNAAGVTTAYDYDAMGRLKTVIYPSQDTVAWNPTSIIYTQVQNDEFGLSPGHWRQDINTGNAASSTYYDALWRPVYTERWDRADRNGTNRAVRYWYDSAGHKTFESYPARNYDLTSEGGVHQEYDALGRPTTTSTISELGTLYSGYAYVDGFRKIYSNARHRSTIYAFQAFDEPVDTAIAAIAMPEEVNVSIDRDLFGKPLAVTRYGGGKSATRSYVYDSAERLCKTIEPETKATVQDYDAAGNVSWRALGLSSPSLTCDRTLIPATRKITYLYDALSRLTTTTFGDGSPAVKRDYTPDGLPNTITSDGATWTNTYNKRRLNEQEKLSYGGVNYTFDRKYDANGSLLRVRYPQDSAWIEYSPNALGEARQVGKYVTAITYAPNGAITSFYYGNGILHQMTPNRRGLPEWSEDTGVLKDKYEYDENGNVTAIADWREGVSNRGMRYDDLDRLVSVNSPAVWGDAYYSYDALDNLVASRLTAGANVRNLVHTFNPKTNLLDSVSNSGGSSYNFSYLYDDFGNVRQRGTQKFVFDLGNRLRSAAGKGTYGYDGLGHRVSVVGTDGVNRIQMYSQEGQLLYVKPSNAATGTKYIHLHNHIIAEATGSAVQYDHTDGLGSPVARTDGAGKLISRTRYEPYGATAAGEPPVIGYAGHMNAADLGLVYMQQRYYDPVAGSFLSSDPVTSDSNSGGSFNRYIYANNNPYKYIDPDGQDAVITLQKDGTVKIILPISFSGPGATANNINAIKADISAAWSGKYSIGGAEKNVSVTVVGSKTDGKLNNITLTTGPTSNTAARGASFVAGGNTGEWNVNSPRMKSNEAAHEGGHLMGAADHYTSETDGNGNRVTTPANGYQGNLMGQLPGKADSKNMAEIMSSKQNVIKDEVK